MEIQTCLHPSPPGCAQFLPAKLRCQRRWPPAPRDRRGSAKSTSRPSASAIVWLSEHPFPVAKTRIHAKERVTITITARPFGILQWHHHRQTRLHHHLHFGILPDLRKSHQVQQRLPGQQPRHRPHGGRQPPGDLKTARRPARKHSSARHAPMIRAPCHRMTVNIHRLAAQRARRPRRHRCPRRLRHGSPAPQAADKNDRHDPNFSLAFIIRDLPL